MATALSFKKEIEYGQQALMLFGAKERRMVLRAAATSAGELWLTKYLMKRFDAGYMKRPPFGYRVKDLSFKQKLRKAHSQGQRPGKGERYDFSKLVPFIQTGQLLTTASTRSKVVVKSPKGNVQAFIKIPFGHGMREEYALMFARIPKREETVLARHVKKEIIAWVNAGSIKRTKSGKRTRTGKRTLAGARSSIASRQLSTGDN